MASARVTLKDEGPSTFTGGGYKFEKGQSRLITNESDIRYFMGQSDFSVTMLEGSAPKRAPEPEPEPEAEEPVDGAPNRAELMKLTKAGLLQYAADDYSLKLDMSMSKAAMVDAILAASETPEDGAESDEGEDADESEESEESDEDADDDAQD